MKSFYFHEPILNMGIVYYWDCESDEFLESTELDDVETWAHTNSVGLTVTENGQYPKVWLKDINNKSVVVHEIVHAVRHIMDSTWIKLSKETEEIFAYYQEFLFNCYLEWVLGEGNKIWVKYWFGSEIYSLSFTKKTDEKRKKLWAKKKSPKKKEKLLESD